MFERMIEVEDVRQILETGEVIEDYPEDTPYASRLIRGEQNGRVLHVVAADNPDEDMTIVITTYEPDPALWSPDFRRRRRR
jgi:hypothetical protein